MWLLCVSVNTLWILICVLLYKESLLAYFDSVVFWTWSVDIFIFRSFSYPFLFWCLIFRELAVPQIYSCFMLPLLQKNKDPRVLYTRSSDKQSYQVDGVSLSLAAVEQKRLPSLTPMSICSCVLSGVYQHPRFPWGSSLCIHTGKHTNARAASFKSTFCCLRCW